MSHVYNEECCCVECVCIREDREKEQAAVEVLQREGQLEIERRWLIDRGNIPFKMESILNDFIAQGYITPSNYDECSKHLSNVTFRVRRKGAAYFFTRKFSTSIGNLVRHETEVQLTAEQFSLMWAMVGEQYIRKTRYYLKMLSIEVELDFFEDKLDGLVIAEIEFDSEKEASLFRAPAWFGKELTDDTRYSNYNLALHGLPEE